MNKNLVIRLVTNKKYPFDDDYLVCVDGTFSSRPGRVQFDCKNKAICTRHDLLLQCGIRNQSDDVLSVVSASVTHRPPSDVPEAILPLPIHHGCPGETPPPDSYLAEVITQFTWFAIVMMPSGNQEMDLNDTPENITPCGS